VQVNAASDAGEMNQLLSIFRHEAWEEEEEVEEDVVASDGHRVVPPWKRKCLTARMERREATGYRALPAGAGGGVMRFARSSR